MKQAEPTRPCCGPGSLLSPVPITAFSPLPCLLPAPSIFLPPPSSSLLLLFPSPNSIGESGYLWVWLSPWGSLQGGEGLHLIKARGRGQLPMSPAPTTHRDPANRGCLSSGSLPMGTPSG